MRTNQDILVATNGTYTVNDTSATSGIRFFAIAIIKETTITALLDENGDDVKDRYISTPANPVSAGNIITKGDYDKPFTSITIAVDGEVTLIL